MSLNISIGRLDHYGTAGEFEASTYSIQINEDNEYIRDIELDSTDDIIVLRDALSHFIDSNNLQKSDTHE